MQKFTELLHINNEVSEKESQKKKKSLLKLQEEK